MVSCNLLNSLINSSSFLVNIMGYSTYMIMPSVNKMFYLFFFKLYACFLPWSIALIKMSSVKLSRNGEGRHSCLVSELGEEYLVFIKYGVSCRILVDVL